MSHGELISGRFRPIGQASDDVLARNLLQLTLVDPPHEHAQAGQLLHCVPFGHLDGPVGDRISDREEHPARSSATHRSSSLTVRSSGLPGQCMRGLPGSPLA